MTRAFALLQFASDKMESLTAKPNLGLQAGAEVCNSPVNPSSEATLQCKPAVVL